MNEKLTVEEQVEVETLKGKSWVRLMFFIIFVSILGGFIAGSFHKIPFSKEGVIIGAEQKKVFLVEAEQWLGKGLEEDFLKSIQNKSAFNFIMTSKMKIGETIYSTNDYRIVVAPFWIPQERLIIVKDASIPDRVKGWWKS
jgi:hypothetical protein